MKSRKGQVSMLLAGIMVVVSGVIGLVIMDSIAADAVNLEGAVNESHTLTCACNASDSEVVTVSNIPIATSADGGRTVTLQNAYGNYTLTSGTNYDILSRDSGTINITDYNTTTNGTSVLVTYDYQDATWFSSSLSRTIMIYLVPLGLLSLLAFVAFLRPF